MLSRRGFLGLFGSAIAAKVDPERLLLVPGAKTISIPSPTVLKQEFVYQPKYYEVITSVNWQAFVNDDLDIFRDLSARLASEHNRRMQDLTANLYGLGR